MIEVCNKKKVYKYENEKFRSESHVFCIELHEEYDETKLNIIKKRGYKYDGID